MVQVKRVFKNARIINVFTGEVLPGSFGVEGEDFVFVDFSAGEEVTSYYLSKNPEAEVFDLRNGFVAPTFIDGHIHIESSHLIPSEFEKFALLSGVSKVVIDPHEIANVCGADGIRFMLSNPRLLDVYVMIPSCVPASPFETSGAILSAKEVEELLTIDPRVLGLAEVMNYPGVINRDPEVIAKIEAAKRLGKLIDGHAPLLSGWDLNRYVYEGVMSDHESTQGKEAIEKVRLGMWLMVREGTASKNINLLESLSQLKDLRRVMLVTDDISPLELEEYMLKTLRKATKYIDPVKAIQMVTINPATYFGLETGIKPGAPADFVMLKDLKKFRLKEVWIKGRSFGEWKGVLEKSKNETKFLGTVNYTYKTVKDFFIPGIDAEDSRSKVRVIKLIKHSLLTEEVILKISEAKELLKKCKINRIYVLERHKGTERIGKGLIQGLLFDGAIASSYAHDSHNVVVIGCELEDVVVAVNTLKDLGGGFVAVKKGKPIAQVPLEVAGIMSSSAEELIKNLQNFYESLSALTKEEEDLILKMSFFSLSVIPELKITDKGLVKNFQLVDLLLD